MIKGIFIILLLILGIIDLVRLAYFRYWQDDIANAALSGVYALICFWVADALERGKK